LRDPKRIPKICQLLEKFWLTQPDWRLCQSIINITGERGDLWFIEDDLLENSLNAILFPQKVKKHNIKKRVVPKLNKSMFNRSSECTNTGHW